MYHCHLSFYCVSSQPALFQAIQQLPPPVNFTYTFVVTAEIDTAAAACADVILADLRGAEPGKRLQALLSARQEKAELILLTDKEQLSLLDEYLPRIKDIWITPLSETELKFRFDRWQQGRKANRDLREEVLQKSHKLETVFSSVDCGIMCHSVDGSRILSVNPAALEILGYTSQDELLEKGFYMVADSVLDEDKPLLREAICSLQQMGDSVDVEYRVRHADGKIFHIMGRVKLIEENGEPVYQRFLLDCTAHKLHEDEVRAKQDLAIHYQKQLFNTFFQYLSYNTDDIYIILSRQKDAALSIEYITPGVEQALGCSPEEIIRQLHCPNPADCAGNLAKCADLGQLAPGNSLPMLETEWVNPKTGMKKYFQEKVHCVEILGEAKIIIYISDRTKEHEIQDTLRVALDIAQAANKAKSAFLSSVSHDIRTPLNAITGFLTLLRQEADDPDYVREYAKRIDAASQQLLRLINDVLDMDKIESGSTTLNITELNLAHAVGELNSVIRPQAKAKKQIFEIIATPFSAEDLLGDSLRINQILTNILSNAVKYTPEGGRITMRISELPKVDDNYVRIQFVIQDSGQGMSEEYLKVIFDPFTREQSAIKKQIQGTGLGMAITKNLVDLMNGTIKVESTLGEGSTFTVELELRVQETETDRDFWKRNGVSRVLVAGGAESAGIVRRMREAGIHADFADGSAAGTVRAAQEQGRPYDVILLDWAMPGLDAAEVIRLSRKGHRRKAPVLLAAAYDWDDIEKEAAQIGAGNFLPKPFFMTNFRETVQRVISSRAEIHPEEDSSSVLKGRHVLVVDDIDVNRLILTKILSTLEATCDTAKTGQEAVDIFLASRPGEFDVILMDVQMPVMDGYEATRVIRDSNHPSSKTIPIIAMTANAFMDDVRDALAAGMDAHIAKPIVLENMKETIQSVLMKK